MAARGCCDGMTTTILMWMLMLMMGMMLMMTGHASVGSFCSARSTACVHMCMCKFEFVHRVGVAAQGKLQKTATAIVLFGISCQVRGALGFVPSCSIVSVVQQHRMDVPKCMVVPHVYFVLSSLAWPKPSPAVPAVRAVAAATHTNPLHHHEQGRRGIVDTLTFRLV